MVFLVGTHKSDIYTSWHSLQCSHKKLLPQWLHSCHSTLHWIEHAMLCYVMFLEKKVIDCHKNNVIKCRTKNILPESRLSHTLSFESYGKYELHFSVFHCGPVFLQRERLVYSTNSPFHAVRSIFTVSNHHHHSFHIS